MTCGQHRIEVCTSCRHRGTQCLPGYRLLRRLQEAMSMASPFVGDGFEISGTAGLAGCSRPCIAAFRATDKAIYLFGDVDPQADIDALVDFAESKRLAETDRSRSKEKAQKMGGVPPFHFPAAVIVTEAGKAALS
ncbi:DUF1636 family protein [Roseibium sp. M-1]